MPASSTSQTPIPLYVLCGGYSKRFGSDKARAIFQDKPLILHVVKQLDLGAGVIAVADQPDKYADLGLETIADKQAHLGPLGGLSAALEHCEHDWFLMVGCDQLMVKRPWVDSLIDRVTKGMAGLANIDAVVYRAKWYEPLPALYRQTIAKHVNDRLRTDDRSMQGLLKAANTLALGLPGDWIAPPSINSPQDLQALNP